MILGLSFPLKTQALTQYAHINATGAALLEGKVVISTNDGVYVLDNGANDDGLSIQAWFKTVRTDFGMHHRKKMRSVYLRGLLCQLKVILKTEGQDHEALYHSSSGDLVQEEGYVQGRRDQAATYWQLRIENVNGTDFSIDSIDVLSIVSHIKRGRGQASG